MIILSCISLAVFVTGKKNRLLLWQNSVHIQYVFSVFQLSITWHSWLTRNIYQEASSRCPRWCFITSSVRDESKTTLDLFADLFFPLSYVICSLTWFLVLIGISLVWTTRPLPGLKRKSVYRGGRRKCVTVMSHLHLSLLHYVSVQGWGSCFTWCSSQMTSVFTPHAVLSA